MAERDFFCAADQFSGARPGYGFKLDSDGLGYYLLSNPVIGALEPTASSDISSKSPMVPPPVPTETERHEAQANASKAIGICKKWLMAKALGSSIEDVNGILKSCHRMRMDRGAGGIKRQVRFSDLAITLVEQPGNAIGSVVWESAFRLCKYLVRLRNSASRYPLAGKQILELGAGTGICGVAAACLGGNVMLTDRDEAEGLIKANLEANKDVVLAAGGCCKFLELDWFSHTKTVLDAKNYDLILASDVVYKADLVPPLLRTIQRFCPPTSRCEVLLTYKQRHPEEEAPFFEQLKALGFILTTDVGAAETEKTASVLYKIHRPP